MLRIRMVVGCLLSSLILHYWGDLTHSSALWKQLRLCDSLGWSFSPASWTGTQAGTIFSLWTCSHIENIFHEQLAPTLFSFLLGYKVSYQRTSFSIVERQLSLCSEWCSVEMRAVLGLVWWLILHFSSTQLLKCHQIHFCVDSTLHLFPLSDMGLLWMST